VRHYSIKQKKVQGPMLKQAIFVFIVIVGAAVVGFAVKAYFGG
jgi:hypothetical protein